MSLRCWYDGYNYLILECGTSLSYLGLFPLIHDIKFSQNIVGFDLVIFCWGFLHWCSWEILVSFLYYSYVLLSLDVVDLVSDIHLGRFSVIFKKYFLFFIIFILLLLYPLCIGHSIFHCSTIIDYSVLLISFLPIFSFLLRFKGFSWYVFKLTDISPQPALWLLKQNTRDLVFYKQQNIFVFS